MPLDIYLHDIPLPEAHAAWNAAIEAAGCWDALPAESVALTNALGRVTAVPVWAKLSAPHYHAAAMDGYAVRAGDTAGATESAPLELRVPDQAIYVDTGDALPQHATAVIPIEAVQPMGSGADTRQPERIQIRAALPPWQHVRATGEDLVATELVLPANQRLRPVDLGALAGCGYGTVLVRRQPRVAIIPTGTELVPAGTDVQPGQIIEYNSLVLGAQVQQWGGVATRWPIVADDFEQICAAVGEAAATHDLVLLNAGSSKGSEDFSARVIAALGKVCLHGVAVRPGHPVILGVLSGTSGQRPTPIVGVPGYPVSAAHTGEIFVEPLLAHWLGMASAAAETITATLTRKVLSPAGDDEYLRVSAGRVNNQVVATPLARGAGVISSLVRADGIVRIPRFSEGYSAGTSVTVHLYRTAAEIDHTILHIGSHDLALDLLAQYLTERAPGLRLSSANVGSLGGLIALARGECHFAGSHLIDPDTGTFNHASVRRYLPELPVQLITLVEREQGLLVAPGNPLRIASLADLARNDVRYVNRQRGAGTRVLLDYELGKLGLTADGINGYEHEEYTHLGVAVAISSGIADCGLGIHAAASALKLDFVPVARERYDLVVPEASVDGVLMQPLLALLTDAQFRAAVSARPGYYVELMGERRPGLL